ncbi:MAG: hypothetical protein KBS45_00520 [Clostridiales bacterium]|nr:hypothetical protein [Candidatus Coliplasma caballi]
MSECAERGFGGRIVQSAKGVQNNREKRELVSGFPSAAVEVSFGRSIKAAHSDEVSGWLQTKVSGWLQTEVSGRLSAEDGAKNKVSPA